MRGCWEALAVGLSLQLCNKALASSIRGLLLTASHGVSDALIAEKDEKRSCKIAGAERQEVSQVKGFRIEGCRD